MVGSEVGVLCISGIEAGFASYECICALEKVPRGRELRLRPQRLEAGQADRSHRLMSKRAELGMRIL